MWERFCVQTSTSTSTEAVNFFVCYEVDEEVTVAQHALSPNNYHMEGTGEAEYLQWGVLEEVKE